MADPTPAVQREAQGEESVTVEYGGNSYVFPPSLEDSDGDVLEAVDEMKLSRAIKGLLGPEQWKAFKATKPKVRDYSDLFDAFAEAIGLPTTSGE